MFFYFYFLMTKLESNMQKGTDVVTTFNEGKKIQKLPQSIVITPNMEILHVLYEKTDLLLDF